MIRHVLYAAVIAVGFTGIIATFGTEAVANSPLTKILAPAISAGWAFGKVVAR